MADDYRSTLDTLLNAFAEWIGGDRSFIDADLAQAIAGVCRQFEDGEGGEIYNSLVHPVNALRVAALGHDERCDEENSVLLKPAADLQDALKNVVLAALSTRYEQLHVRRKALEPVAQLKKTQDTSAPITDTQICLMYGWGDWETGFHTEYIDDELKDPGCHSTKDPHWLPPNERRRAAELLAAKEQWDELFIRLDRKVACWDRKPQESLAELVRQKVHMEQLCLMFRCDEEEIERRCRKENLPIPERLANLAAMRGTFDRPEPEELTRIFARQEQPQVPKGAAEDLKQAAVDANATEADAPSGETQEQQIVRLFLGGHDAKAISKQLRVSKGRVDAVIARHTVEPEAFATNE